MALYNNGYRLGNTPFKRGLGALSSMYNGGGSALNNAMPTSMMRVSAWLYGQMAGYPKGGCNPQCWMLPQKPGAMAVKTSCFGTGTLTIDMAAGFGIEGEAAGIGSAASEVVGMAWIDGSASGVADAAAELSALGLMDGQSEGVATVGADIFAAVAVQGQADGAATVSGGGYLAMSGDGVAEGASTVSGSMGALLGAVGEASGSGSAEADITGAFFGEGTAEGLGTASGGTPLGLGWMTGGATGSSSAELVPYAIGSMSGSTGAASEGGELTAEQIAQAVWSFEQ